MKKLLKVFLCMSLLFVAAPALNAMNNNCNSTCSTTNNNCSGCTSIYIPRSVGDNLARQATYKNYQYGEDCFRGDFSIEYRYQASRKSCDIATSLFGSSTLHFQGSTVKAGAANDANSLLADNFGLSPAEDNYISFAPKIKNNIVDFELYFGLDQWYEGLFFQLNLPLCHSKFALNMGAGSAPATTTINGCSTSCSTSCSTGNNGCSTGCSTSTLPTPATTPFNPGCVGEVYLTGTTTLNPVAPATAYCGTNGALSGNFLFGDMQTKWIAGSFCNGCNDETRLASVNMILGYNFYECPDYNFGVFIRAAAPTGTEENCCTVRNVFSTQIGDNHWKLGGGITGHYELYNCDDEHMVNVYFEGYLEHLFSRCQVRSFDWTGKGCLSRYMLLKEFNPASTPANEYFSAPGNTNGSGLINGINYTTRRINTNIGVQGEGQIEFVYNNSCGFSAGLGWNIYGRSDEKGCNIGAACDATIGSREFGFKGCADVQGFCYNLNATNPPTSLANPLVATPTYTASTQSNATITNQCSANTTDDGANYTTALVAGGTVCLSYCNMTAAQIAAVTGGAAVTAFNTPAGTVEIAGVVEPLLQTSGTAAAPAPVLVSTALLNVNSGLLDSQITNKVFGHLDYAWTDCDWTPNVYVGGEVEFASHAKRGAMNAWGVYAGAGVSF